MKQQFLRFAIAGIIGFGVDAGVLYMMLALHAGPYLGRIASFLCAVLATWMINRHFTFQRQTDRSLWREWWEYLVAMSGGGACNYGAYVLSIRLLADHQLKPLAAVACGSIAGLLVNFLVAKYWVFRTTKSASSNVTER